MGSLACCCCQQELSRRKDVQLRDAQHTWGVGPSEGWAEARGVLGVGVGLASS